jgi:hypothetical protein
MSDPALNNDSTDWWQRRRAQRRRLRELRQTAEIAGIVGVAVEELGGLMRSSAAAAISPPLARSGSSSS